MVSVSNHQLDGFQAHHLPGGGAVVGGRWKRCRFFYKLPSASLVTPASTLCRYARKSAAGFRNTGRDLGFSNLHCRCGTRPLTPRDRRVVTLVGFVRVLDAQGRKAHYTHGDQRCEVLTFKAKSGPELFVSRLIMRTRMVISVAVLT